jgi:hypothetical protein
MRAYKKQKGTPADPPVYRQLVSRPPFFRKNGAEKFFFSGCREGRRGSQVADSILFSRSEKTGTLTPNNRALKNLQGRDLRQNKCAW